MSFDKFPIAFHEQKLEVIMATLDEVRSWIKELDTDTFGTKKEIKCLPEILGPDERIFGLTSGLMDGNTWLITLTNERIIFLDKGFLFGLKQIETPLEKVNSIEHKTGLVFGEIAIWDGSSKMVIKNVIKTTVKPFIKAVNEQIRTFKQNNHQSENCVDLSHQLEKLAKLKKDGVLTDSEFQEQKRKLLAA